MTLDQFWPQCLHHLRHTLPAKQYQSWIEPLSVGEGAGGEWVVYAPSRFVLNMLRTRYAAEIDKLLAERLPENTPTLLFKQGEGKRYAPADKPASVRASKAAAPTEQAGKPATPQHTDKRSALEIVQSRLESLGINPQAEPTGQPNQTKPTTKPAQAKSTVKREERQQQRYAQTNLSPEYTFDTLVEGKGNRLAVAAARSIAENPGKNYNPFFLYGSTGLGKTHLAQAVGNELLRLKPEAKVYYMHAEDFVRGMIQAFRNHAHDAFRQQYKPYDFLIIDDIQFIKGKDRTMEEFFYLYNHFHNEKKQLILTCDVLPAKIEGMDDRLKSRFSWGLTLELEPPELEMRVAILQKKAEAAGISIEDEAALFVANLIRSNVRELEGAFNRVSASSRFMNRPVIDMDLARTALQDIIAEKHKIITADTIIDATAKYYRIKISDILGKKRTRNIARPRQVAMSLTKELTTLSLPSIGDAFGGRDHTTVMHGVKAVAKLREEDPELAQDYEKLLILIQN